MISSVLVNPLHLIQVSALRAIKLRLYLFLVFYEDLYWITCMCLESVEPRVRLPCEHGNEAQWQEQS